MDPFTIIQVVGTVVSLTDVVIKSITKLNSIKARYHNCPLLVVTMIGQLCTVQSALGRLADWNSPERTRDPRYQQLGLQIGNSLDNFSPLILALQQQLDRFEGTAPMQMGAKQKLKFLWSEKDMSEYSILLDRQVNALNLLLHALECSSWSQQNAFVSQAESQQILSIARDCSSSIAGIDGSLSLVSEDTDRISLRFDFDTLILGSMVYQQAERSHLRQAIRGVRSRTTKITTRIQGPVTPHPDSSSSILTERTNRRERQTSSMFGLKKMTFQLRETRIGRWWEAPRVQMTTGREATRVQRKTGQELAAFPRFSDSQRVLILGTSESGKSTLQKCMILDRKGFSDKFRESFVETIWHNFIDGTRKVIQCMKQLNISFQDRRLESQAKALSKQKTLAKQKAAWLFEALWNNTGFQRAYSKRHEYHLNEGYAYFVRHAKRLMSSEYMPSDQDVINTRIKTVGLDESKFEYGGIKYTVHDVGGAKGERIKWGVVFPNTDILIYTVDVTSYARVCCEDGDTNRMQDQLTIFGGLVNSPKFVKCDFVLVFTKVDLLEEWFRMAPAKKYFQDLEEGTEDTRVELYMTYLQQRFMDLALSEDTRSRIRVIQSSFDDVATYNPAQGIFKALDELTYTRGRPRPVAAAAAVIGDDERIDVAIAPNYEESDGEHSTISIGSHSVPDASGQSDDSLATDLNPGGESFIWI
ncbi:hypothetical protein PG984_003885 [Apiospora sp. TS-2023a]